MEKFASQKAILPLLKRHGSTGTGQLAGWSENTGSRQVTEQLSAVQRNYEAISAMMQIKQDELRKALNELARERHTTSALEREVNILKQAWDARTSSECRAASFENQSQDLQSKLQQAQTEREVQQAELAGARKELQKLATNLDEERRLNAVLCDQAKSLKADISGAKRKIEVLSQERDRVHEDLQDASTQLSTEQKMRADLLKQAEEAHEHIAHLQLLAQQHSCKASAATAENVKLHAKVSETTSAIGALETHLAAAKERTSSLEEQLLVTKTAAWEHQRAEVAELRTELAQQAQVKADIAKRASVEQKELRAELLAVSTQLTKASTDASSADSAAEAAAHEVTVLRAKLAQCQQSVQSEREAAQALQDKYCATELDLRQQLQRASSEFNEQRCSWRCALHRRVHQIEVLEQHVFNSLQLQQVQQAEHTQHFCALIAEVEQQLACWVSTVQIVERTQANVLGKACALAAAQTTNKSQTQKLRDSWVGQVTALQQQLQSTKQRLADTISGRDSDIDEMASRFSIQMQDTSASLSSRVAALQAEVDALKASSAACYAAYDDRLQTERNQQRKANEEMRAAMHSKLQDASRETEEAKNHLVVLSKQHQLTLQERESQYKSLQGAMETAAKNQQHAILSVVADGCTAVLEVAKSIRGIGQVLTEDKQEDESVDFTEALVASDLSQEDPERLARALAGLKSYANSVHEDCGRALQRLTQSSKTPQHQLLLPDFNDQERQLRSVIDKLVQVERSLESNYTCLSCLSIFDDPVICFPCGHCSCRACCTEQTCPECQAKDVQLVPARNLARLAGKFEFKMQALLQIQTMVEGKIVEIQ